MEQVKLLKTKTNNRILEYEKTNSEQKKEIELLKEQLKVVTMEKEVLMAKV